MEAGPSEQDLHLLAQVVVWADCEYQVVATK